MLPGLGISQGGEVDSIVFNLEPMVRWAYRKDASSKIEKTTTMETRMTMLYQCRGRNFLIEGVYAIRPKSAASTPTASGSEGNIARTRSTAILCCVASIMPAQADATDFLSDDGSTETGGRASSSRARKKTSVACMAESSSAPDA